VAAVSFLLTCTTTLTSPIAAAAEQERIDKKRERALFGAPADDDQSKGAERAENGQQQKDGVDSDADEDEDEDDDDSENKEVAEVDEDDGASGSRSDEHINRLTDRLAIADLFRTSDWKACLHSAFADPPESDPMQGG
jgi:cobalamin biosynthesis protein CobT